MRIDRSGTHGGREHISARQLSTAVEHLKATIVAATRVSSDPMT